MVEDNKLVYSLPSPPLGPMSIHKDILASEHWLLAAIEKMQTDIETSLRTRSPSITPVHTPATHSSAVPPDRRSGPLSSPARPLDPPPKNGKLDAVRIDVKGALDISSEVGKAKRRGER